MRKKLIIPLLIIFIGGFIGYKGPSIKSKYQINNKELVSYIFNEALPKSNKTPLLKDTIDNITNYYDDTTNLLNSNLQTEPTIKEEQAIKKEEKEIEPTIYLYNTHQTEEYQTSTILDQNVKPTVMIGNYILEELFNAYNYKSYVEEESIKEILNNNRWSYSYSYLASRHFLEKRIKEMPSLKYFIDIHRDSLTKDKTTVIIGNKSYAKLLFLIGLDNPNYQENLRFTESINNKLNEKYPSLSKGIYKKGGPGVNGVYNQDFSPYVILIEVGGYENTPIEVLNSLIAFSECFMEVINYEIK